MKAYCFHIRAAATGKKVVGGMIHADNMEGASKRVLERCDVETVKNEEGTGYATYDNFRSGKKVFLYLSIHPEYIIDDSKMTIKEIK